MPLYLIVLLIGIVAQYVDGALGMGFGALSSAFLLAAGLLPTTISASIHVGKVFAGISSGVSHLKFGNVDRGITVALTIGGVAGGVVGTVALCSVPGHAIKPFIAGLLLLLGVRIFIKFLLSKKATLPGKKFSKKYLGILGIVGGTVDAIGGGGWGPICTSTLVSTGKLEPRIAIGSVNVAEVFTSIAIVISFFVVSGFNYLMWPIIVPLVAGSIVIAPIAAWSAKKLPQNIIGAGVGIVLVVLNIATVIKSVKGVPWMKTVDPANVYVVFLIFLLTAIVVAKHRAEKSEKANGRPAIPLADNPSSVV